MKKLLPYILIFATLVGIFGSGMNVRASDPIGTCLKDGKTTSTTQGMCAKIDGSWTVPNSMIGTCSINGTTSPSPQYDCEAGGGIWTPPSSGGLTDPIGTCLKDGKTTSTTQGMCAKIDGSWTVPNSMIGTCSINGTTSPSSQYDCEATGGSWSSSNSGSPTNPVGTCLKDGKTTSTTEGACVQIDGSWTPPSSMIGTCSINGTTSPSPQRDCEAIGGSWSSSNSGGSGSTNSTHSTYNFLAPLPSMSSTFDPASAGGGDLGKYLNVMITLFIGICAVLAVIMIVLGGVEYMTSDLVSSKEEGKERILHAILGLLLALFAWILLYTINPNLLNTSFSSLEAVTVTVDLEADVPQATTTNARGQKVYSNGAVAGTVLDDTFGKIATLPAGVSIYNSQCTTVGQSGCTSTRGLDLSTINTILANCSGCVPLLITGGTEYWLHGGKTGSTSHQPGSPTVDLNPTSALTQYIAGGQTLVYYHRYPKDGISYLWENNHWHAGP